MISRSAFFVFALLFSFSAFADDEIQPQDTCVPGQVTAYKSKFRSKRTGYFPDGSEMEGGFKDRVGNPLHTLQAYLAGKAPYVSVAMDSGEDDLPYGTRLRIPAVELYFHRCIEFRVVDTGGRFEGAGKSKIDICNSNEHNALGPWTNGMADIYKVGR